MYIRGKMEKELRRGRRKEEEERKEGQGGKKEWCRNRENFNMRAFNKIFYTNYIYCTYNRK